MAMRVAAQGLLALAALQEVSSAPVTVSIAQGQSLNIPLSGWVIGGAVNILDAGADVAFSFNLMQMGSRKYIGRTSTYNGATSLEEAWGGWPLGPTSRPTNLQFTLAQISATSTKVSVVVNDVQYPWFDFQLPPGKNGPFAGYELVNLQTSSTPTVATRTCPIMCQPGECAINGMNQNVKLLNGFCATALSNTGGECCTGAPSTFTESSIVEGAIATIVPNVISDDTYLDRACASVDVLGTCPEFVLQRDNQLPFNRKVYVISRERDAQGLTTGRVLVYLPMSHAKLMASPWMLVPAVAVSGTATFTGVPVLGIDQGNGQVTFNPQFDGGVLPFNYITRLQQGNDLFQFTHARWQTFAASGIPYTMTYSDAPQLDVESSCSSDMNWMDGQATPKGCRRYGGLDGNEPWCTKFGVPTDAWKLLICNGGNCGFQAFANNGKSALEACCECGGGTPAAVA